MAEATNFPESNHVLHPPPGVTPEECSILSVWRGKDQDDRPVVISCWKLTDEELREVHRTCRIWLWLWGNTMQPAAVSGVHPMSGRAAPTVMTGKVKSSGTNSWIFDPVPVLQPGDQLKINGGVWEIVRPITLGGNNGMEAREG